MGQKPKRLTPTASHLDFFGAQLRALRGELAIVELAPKLLVSPDLLRKVEVGERYPSEAFIRIADDVLDAGGLLLAMGPLLLREQRLKARAGTKASVFSPDSNDAFVLDWMLTESTWEPVHDATQDEAHSSLAKLRKDDHLLGAGATYPRTRIFLETELESLTQSQPLQAISVLELAAYSAVDLGSDAAAQQHYHQALRTALRTGHRRHGAHLIASLAYLTMECGHPRSAARLAQAVIAGVAERTTPTEGAVWWIIKARAHAMMRERQECLQALGKAEEHLAREPADDEVELISYFGAGDLADERAHCFFELGDFDAARAEASKALSLFAPDRVRRKVIDSSLYSAGLVRSGELEQAAEVAKDAIGASGSLQSFRASQALARMMAELLPHQQIGAVRDVFDLARVAAPVTPTLRAGDG
jgi:tetratricopeptide (TPR) repeat protein